MSNMSYCRFENTASDLGDCREHILDKLNEYEGPARVRLVKLCVEICRELGFYVVDEDGKAIDDKAIEDATATAENDEEEED